MQILQLNRRKLEHLLDILSLGVVLLYVAYKFINTTTFPFVYRNTFRFVFVPLLVVGALRVLYFFLQDLRQAANGKDRLLTLGKYVLAGCAALPFAVVAVHIDILDLMSIPLAMACLYRMQPERVLRGYVCTVGPLLAATVLCCLAGVIQNICGWDTDSYGIVNTTDYAAYFVFLMLAVWCTQRTRTWYATFAFVLLCCVVGAAGNSLAGSRTTGICSVLLAFACVWEWLESALPHKGQIRKLLGKAVDVLCVALFPLVAALVARLVFLVGQGNEHVLELDVVLSHRLTPTWGVVQTYGIQLLGSDFMMHGNGSSVFGVPGTTYDYLDISYAYLAIRYGKLIFALVMCLWMWMTWRALKGGKRRIAYSLAIVTLYGFSEAQMMHANYNVFLLMPFCAFVAPAVVGEMAHVGTEGERQRSQEHTSDKAWALHAILAIVLIFAGFAILPRAMSCLRTFFYLKGWTGGMHTAWALVFCLVLVVAVAAAWKVLPSMLLKRTKRAYAVLTGSVAVLVCLTLLVNLTIGRGLEERSDELDAEAETVQLILDSASQPIYAAEKSELYQRRFGGLTDHALLMSGIGAGRVGTVLVDKSNEGLRLQQYGASYCQFSETSGLYTFDPAVVEALTAAGFTWQPFYSSERMYDLRDVAARNGLAMNADGAVLLDGPDHSISENRRLDQLGGTYEVRLVLSVEPSVLEALKDDAVCTFQVTKNSEDVLFEQPVTKAEFDEEGKADVTISYAIEAAPRVEHLVIAQDGARISLSEMAWKRVA